MCNENFENFADHIRKRRSIRHFSSVPVPESIINECVNIAASSPSGANQQPWHFVIVYNQELKKQIRQQAEIVEKDFYYKTAPLDWLKALSPLDTTSSKPFLENAPVLIVVFMQKYSIKPDGAIQKHYYPLESIGIATGMFLSALQMASLASLVYTPPKRAFLNNLLGRPKSEKAFAIIVTGYAEIDHKPPKLDKKGFSEMISVFN